MTACNRYTHRLEFKSDHYMDDYICRYYKIQLTAHTYFGIQSSKASHPLSLSADVRQYECQ